MHTFLVLNPSAVTAWKVKSDGKGFEAKPCFQNSANKWAKADAALYSGMGRWGTWMAAGSSGGGGGGR